MPGRHASFDAAHLAPIAPEEDGASAAVVVPRRVPVLLPLPLAGAYDYAVPPEIDVESGDFVVVPLGRRHVVGVVWDRPEGASEEVAAERLKPIEGTLDVPALSAELRRLVDWVASYTLAPPGAVLRMAMSVGEALEPPRPVSLIAPSASGLALLQEDAGKTLTPARRRVLQELADGPPRPAVDLARAAGCTTAVVKGLLSLGHLQTVLRPARLARPELDWHDGATALSLDQRRVADALRAELDTPRFVVTLLDGVTGSGKTEVYFAAIARALELGRQVLILLPEIALGAQFLDRFVRRFGARPVEWHSDLGHAERRAAWRDVAEGTARVVVGARSALFLPFHELGLIVVDEEHESSFKQEEGVVYHARDMAVVRASIARIPIILVSATPSLETVVNVEQGRYRCLHLPDRHAGAELPRIKVIDLRRDKPERQRFLAPPLVAALEETLAAKEQAMLFLNRRGYAPLTLCRHCGHRLECPNCTAWLVEHRFHNRLQCHHCGHGETMPMLCPSCGESGTMAACGPGVERLAEEVAARFPDARLAVMASDTLTGPRSIAAMVSSVQDHGIDILIGTQIVAKGHHFPMLTLVGVVDADLGLAGGDLRAAERTYQLLHQVAGRAGRAERPGTVYLQTFMPEHPVIAALVKGDRDGFLAAEADARRQHLMPPFGRLAAVIVSSGDGEEADFVARALARAAPQMPGVDVLGPAPAPLAVLRSRHRRRFLVKALKSVNIQAILRDWVARVKVPGGTRVQVDVDPYSFL